MISACSELLRPRSMHCLRKIMHRHVMISFNFTPIKKSPFHDQFKTQLATSRSLRSIASSTRCVNSKIEREAKGVQLYLEHLGVPADAKDRAER